MSNFLPDILRRWTATGRYTVAELADAAECSVALMYKYIEGEREMPFDRARRLALYASRTHGDNDIAASLLSASFEVCQRDAARADGCLNDESADLSVAMGTMIAAHRGRDRARMDEGFQQFDEVRSRLLAERDRL